MAAQFAFCMKCHKATEMTDSKEVVMKDKQKALKGKCSECGTGQYKILPKKTRKTRKKS